MRDLVLGAASSNNRRSATPWQEAAPKHMIHSQRSMTGQAGRSPGAEGSREAGAACPTCARHPRVWPVSRRPLHSSSSVPCLAHAAPLAPLWPSRALPCAPAVQHPKVQHLSRRRWSFGASQSQNSPRFPIPPPERYLTFFHPQAPHHTYLPTSLPHRTLPTIPTSTTREPEYNTNLPRRPSEHI